MVWEFILLCLASVAAGAINSIAGGGTLLTFPVLAGILALQQRDEATALQIANQTSSVALMPGSLAGAWGYRRQLAHSRRWFRWLIGPSLVGGLIGSLLLTEFPADAFKSLVPWLIFTAALLFALQPQISRWSGIGKEHAEPSGRRIWAIVFFQFLVAVYGGYFGAGIGILMLCALALMGMSDIHAMNGLKTVLAAAINGMSVLVFSTRGQIEWKYALPMMACAIAGGYGGASIALRINRVLVRRLVVAIGFSLAAYYFYREFVAGT